MLGFITLVRVLSRREQWSKQNRYVVDLYSSYGVGKCEADKGDGVEIGLGADFRVERLYSDGMLRRQMSRCSSKSTA
jgi:hypothetical protein